MSSQFFLPVYIALYFFTSPLTRGVAHPLIDPYYTEDESPQVDYVSSSAAEPPLHPSFVYGFDDPDAYYLDAPIGSLMSYREANLDANPDNYPATSKDNGNFADEEFLAGLYSLMIEKMKENVMESGGQLQEPYNDHRSKVAEKKLPIDPEFLAGVYSRMTEMVKKKLATEEQPAFVWLDNNAADYTSARSNEGNIDPNFINGIRAAMLEMMKRKRVDAGTKPANNFAISISNGSTHQSPIPYSSGYVFHPMPVPVIQTIQEAHFGEPTIYNDQESSYVFVVPPKQPTTSGSPSSGSSPSTAKPSAALSNKPAGSLPSKPSAPLPTTDGSLPSVGYISPNQDSIYLQPMYAAPAPVSPFFYQVWPFTNADTYKPFTSPVDWRISNMLSSGVNSQNVSQNEYNKPSVETNLTKIDIDPVVVEKKANAHHVHSSRGTGGSRGSEGTGRDKKFGTNFSYRPDARNPVSGRSAVENEPMIERRRSVKKHNGIPLMKRVLIPVSPPGKRPGSPGTIHKEQANEPRYKVLYHLQKTYVPVSS